MFRRLQTRLTVLYTALFGAVLAALAVVVQLAVTDQARRYGADGLAATGAVFERLWEVRAERLQGGALLLSRDYGFRQALETGDGLTVDSAVNNLRQRLSLDLAFVVDAQGRLIGASDPRAAATAARARTALVDGGEARGVLVVGDAPYEVVSAPILAPELKGWIVFAVRLDAGQMSALTRLSSVPLRASVVWRAADLARAARAGGGELTLLRRLPSVEGAPPAALRLRYAMSEALAPYRSLLWIMAAVGAAGLALVVGGSWLLARSVTRPLSSLTEAARRLTAGDVARVGVQSRDELGELAGGFNRMADAVAERERRLVKSALTDAETGLPNRPALERAARALVTATGTGAGSGSVYVAAFGVERYARMRGAIGYELAGELLRALGGRLQALNPHWSIARTSADILSAAFVAADPADAAARVEAARRMLEGAQPVGDQLIDVRVVSGLGAGDGPDQLVREADLALDAARAGAVSSALFNPSARAKAAESLQLMPALRQAIAEDGLTLVHQPKYDVRRGAVTGVESLVRWTHPRLGPLGPDLFIGLAEETGDVRALTEWVTRRALAEQAELAREGQVLAFSINLSGRLVGDPHFTPWLLETLASAAGPICLEITETAVIGHPDAALADFRRFAEAGIAVSIDDYGSGLSSLAYLKRIDAAELKLDRSLICDVSRSARDALLVRSTIDLAHGLGMKVVAEGVEDETTLALLAGMGCDLIQGWHVARPMALEALRRWMAPAAPAEARRA